MSRLSTRMPMLHGTLQASGLGIALLGLVVIAFVSSGNLAALRNAFDWDAHTYVVLISANEMQVDLADLEPGAVAPPQTLGNNVQRQLDRLTRLTVDNSAQQQRLKILSTDLGGILTSAQRGPALARARADLQQFIEAERRLLAARSASAYGTLHATVGFLLLSCTLAAIVLVIVYLLETSRLSRAELKLHSVSSLQTAILKSANYALISFSVDGSVTSFNSTAERWLGYAAADVIGKQLLHWHDGAEVAARADLLSKELGYPVAADFRALVVKAQVGLCDESEWNLIRKDATRFPASLSVTALGTVTGALSGYLCVIADITERREVDRMKSEFIATVSHELRTPLTSIRGALGLIENGVLGKLPEKAQTMVRIAHHNSQRLVHIINDILDIETMESGNLDPHLGRVPAAEFLKQALDGNQSYAAKYQVRFELEAVPEDSAFLADSGRLMQVMNNLLSNAAKFSSHGATVSVRALAHGTKLRVEVKDRGAGIPEEFRRRIFEKFAQADSSASRSAGGTGLGLSITRKLVLAMGGTIGFDSVLGQGTIFFFELPQADAVSPAVMGSDVMDTGRFGRLTAAVGSVTRADPPRILHVEDDQDFSRVIEAALGEAVHVVHASTLAAAQTLLLEQTFSLIVLDLMLPDGNSLDLLDSLRNIGGRLVPVVILSSAEVSRKVKARVAGALVKSRVSEANIVRTILALALHPAAQLAIIRPSGE
jgi:PAS domain S-box-containing protein